MFTTARRRLGKVGAAIAAAFALAGAEAPAAFAVQVTQFFPAAPEGQAAPAPKSGWRITWNVLASGTHGYGGSAVWEIQRAEFMRGKTPDGAEDWVTVLNNLALAEMFVPYHAGFAFWDISQFFFPFTPARADYLPASGIVRGTVHEDNTVISEVIDDHVRWIDNRANAPGGTDAQGGRDGVQRGQALHLWATFYSANYRYILSYAFADDGTIRVRAGGTAENLRDISEGNDNHATHVHMPAWRMEFDLGDATKNRVDIVERTTDASGMLISSRRPFKDGKEGGEVWDPTKFTVLKITNTATQNRHQPPRNISYVLKPVRSGVLRADQPYTQADFWVSRRDPDDPNRAASAPELKFIDVPTNVGNPEPIADKAVVVWHHASLNHIPRTEDFGPVDYLARQGVAINLTTGFDLVPVDFWHKTPFLERAGGDN